MKVDAMTMHDAWNQMRMAFEEGRYPMFVDFEYVWMNGKMELSFRLTDI